LRYFLLGLLGAVFGQQAIDYLMANKILLSLVAVGLILAGYFLARWAHRNADKAGPTAQN
jgi:hypothetical protein